MGFLKARENALHAAGLSLERHKCLLVYPSTLNDYLRGINNLFGGLIDRTCTLALSYLFIEQEASRAVNDMMREHFAEGCVTSLRTCSVKHIYGSMGLVLELSRNAHMSSTSSPFKLVYSGDCRPNEMLVKLGKGCDLLIHEASFDESCMREAIKNNHSTIREGK